MDTKKLRQKVLDLAIHGKLVKQDPNDEPASILLDRIRAEKARLVKEGKIKKSDLIEKPISEDEIPFEVPEGWEWVRLNDLAYFGGGKTPSMDNKLFWENGTNLWITSKDMKSSRIFDSQMKISDVALSDMQIYDAGTILMVTRSGILRRTLPLAILMKQATVNQDLKTISLTDTRLTDYIYISILAQEQFILKEFHKDGTTVDSINFDKFKGILLPIPTLAEQHRIVKAVDELFEQIDIIERSEKELEEAANKTRDKLLNLAIQGHLVPQDPNEEPVSVLLERIRAEKARLVKEGKLKKKDLEEKPISPDEIPFDIPEGWVWVRGNTVFLPMESTKPSGDKFVYIDVDAVNNKTNVIDNAKVLASSKAPSRASRKLHNHDILFSMVRPYLKNIAYVDEMFANAIASTGFYVITPTCGLFPMYLFYLVLSPYVVNGLNQYMKGDNSPSINNSHIEQFLFPLPPLSEQRRIVTKLEELLQEIDKLKA